MGGSRYHKQEIFDGIGVRGQAALRGSSVLVAGCGALGGVIATILTRAGVGWLRVVDRDAPDQTNLHRQILYDEADAASGRPKAVIAAGKLQAMNREVSVEGIAADITADNVTALADGMDLIMDGLDNQETRYLINDAAVRRGIPWVYAGCVASVGNVMTIIPGKTPCLRCVFPTPAPSGTLPTCDTVGIIGPTPALTGSVAAAEALKLLSGAGRPLTDALFVFDLWTNAFRVVPLARGLDPHCPCCGAHRFDFLTGSIQADA